MADHELDAMLQMLGIMEKLDAAAQGRAIRWMVAKLDLPSVSVAGSPTNVRGVGGVVAPNDKELSSGARFRDFADLFDCARPKTDVDKALIAAYWVQFCKGNPDFASQSINDELKQLGHPVGNITRALGALIQNRPSFVQQLRKDGGSRQARKTYRLTNAGQKKVDQMCGARTDDERQNGFQDRD